MATIKDIADKVGVSITTVSRVLNYDETLSVSDAIRKKIFETAEELNYKKNKKNKQKKILKFCIIKGYSDKIELEDPYYLSIRILLEKKLKEKNIEYIILNKSEINESIKIFDGIMCIGIFYKNEIKNIKNLNENTIFVDSNVDDYLFDSVAIDMKKAVDDVIKYILSLNHTKIGFIGGRDNIIDKQTESIIDFRELYFINFTKKLNIYNDNFVRIGDFTPHSGYELMKDIIKKDIPTAIFVANDSMAIGAYRAISEAGLTIPDDISIVGFNDIPTSQFLFPPLTTVKVPTELLVDTSIELLLDKIKTQRIINKKIIIPTELIIRESCKKI